MKPNQLIAASVLAVVVGGLHAQTTTSTPGTASNSASVPRPGETIGHRDSLGQSSEQGADAARSKLEPRIIQGNDQLIASPPSYKPVEGSASSYKFEEAPIVDVVHVFMREILKTDYILHPPLNGTVTLATRGTMTPDDALALLESALQVNGLAMGRDARGVYHIGKQEALRGVVSNIRVAGGKGPMAPGYGAVIIPLEYIGATEMAAILKPMVAPEAIVRVDNLRNMLVMMGTRTQAEGWMEMVKTFDVSMLKGMSVGIFPLKHASISEVESALQLLNSGGAAGGGAPAPAPGRQAPAQGAGGGANAAAGAAANPTAVALSENFPLYGAIRVLPIARINSIMVVTPRAAYLEEARRWIEKLDQPSDNGSEPQLFIYQVQNVNSRHLATVLSGIFSGMQNPFQAAATGATGVAPGLGGAAGGMNNNSGNLGYNNMGNSNNPYGGGLNNNNYGGGGFGNNYGGGFGGGFGQSAGTGFGSGGLMNMNQRNQANNNRPSISVTASFGNIRVVADELNNSVLIWATKAEYERIEGTLKRLDIPPTQVLIEASIVEVTLTDGLDYGLQWAFSDQRPLGHQGRYSGTGYIGGDPAGLDLSKLGSGFTYSLTNSAGNIRAVLTALSQQTKLKVVSSPSLMVLDNHTASIAVGTQQPVATSTTNYITTTAPAATSTVQYKDTGVNLQVTPSVNAGNLVTMQVDQMLTDIGAPVDTGDGNKQPAFMQRQISSKVAVRSGDAIVLGGLIKDSDKKSSSGVPFLSSIPVVGGLFGTKGSSADRTELLVVISPRVVRTDIDIREVSDDLRDRMRGLRDVNGFERSKAEKKSEPIGAPMPQ